MITKICPYCDMELADGYNEHVKRCYEEYASKQSTKKPEGEKQESRSFEIGRPNGF